MVLSHQIKGSYIRFSISATDAFAVWKGLKLSGGRQARFRVAPVVVELSVWVVVEAGLVPQPVKSNEQVTMNNEQLLMIRLRESVKLFL